MGSIPKEPDTSQSTYPQEGSGSTKQQDSQEDSTNLKEDSETTVDTKLVKGQKSKHADSEDTKACTSTKSEEPEVRILYFG